VNGSGWLAEPHPPGQSLRALTERLLHFVSERLVQDRPDVVVLQGDMATAFAGALAAFYLHVPAAHVEARSQEL